MPIYEYQCKACGHYLEALQKLSDAPLTSCPKCSQDKLEKMVSAAAFQLKGSGWYVTDFRNKKANSNTATSDESASTSTDTKTDNASGSKDTTTQGEKSKS